MYGHVGDGNIHTRPLLDPKDPRDLRTMQRLYDEVSAYVRGIRGTMSGEHGDGLLRTPYLREMYGETVYSLFSLVKNAFDPAGVMNPGKKVGPQEPSGSLLRDLRYGFDYRTLSQKPILHFPASEYEREIEKCHGCGQCKSMVATTMCPTYKATCREHASPRAKANLLRGIITGALDPASAYGEAATKIVTDYCIVCGMCAVECPSNVNIPKLMLEAKSKYRDEHHGSPADAVLGHAETTSALGRRFASLTNPLLAQPLLRRLAEPVTGIDRRRRMPRFARRTFAEIAASGGGLGRVVTKAADDAELDPSGRTTQGTAAADRRRAGDRAPRWPPTSTTSTPDTTTPDWAWRSYGCSRPMGSRSSFPTQRASGIPEMLYGYDQTARETARFNVDAILPLGGARRGAGDRRADRQLRLQDPLPRLPGVGRLFV